MNSMHRWHKNLTFTRTKIIFVISVIVVPPINVSIIGCTNPRHRMSMDAIERYCENELDFESVDHFESFIADFKVKSKLEFHEEKVPRICLNDREAILELDGLISRTEVCDPDKVERLIAYHKRHFRSNPLFNLNKPVTRRFFTKYAIQVAYTCKKNLLKNLDMAREELTARSRVFDEARERVYSEEPSIKSNIKLIEEQPEDPVSTNVKPQDEAELTLNEYREALTKLNRVEDILIFDRDDCESGRHRETIITTDKLQLFFKPAVMCHQLHRYYAGSLLTIAKLANYGYMALDETLDSQIVESPQLKDWIVAVQVCDPLLFMSTKEIRDEVAIIDTCSPRVSAIEPIVYGDNFTDFDNELLKSMIPRSRASRARARSLMKSALRRMARMDMMKQLENGAKKKNVFSRSLALLSSYKTGSKFKSQSDFSLGAGSTGGFSIRVSGSMSTVLPGNKFVQRSLSDEESYELLKQAINGDVRREVDEGNEIDGAVSVFDPVSSLVTSLTVMVIMLSFEWLFFIIMTLAARICYRMYFNFENLLTFPPKFLSWSDADFARFSDRTERVDEDDLFDYEELSPDEQRQRELLSQVFGRPPPMLYKD